MRSPEWRELVTVTEMEVRHCELPSVIELWKCLIDDHSTELLTATVFLSGLRRHRHLQVDGSVVARLAYPCRQPNFDTWTPATFGTCEEAPPWKAFGRAGRDKATMQGQEQGIGRWTSDELRHQILPVDNRFANLFVGHWQPWPSHSRLINAYSIGFPGKEVPSRWDAAGEPWKRTVPQLNCPAQHIAASFFRAAFLNRDHPRGIGQMGTRTTLAFAQGKMGQSHGQYPIPISTNAWVCCS